MKKLKISYTLLKLKILNFKLNYNTIKTINDYFI